VIVTGDNPRSGIRNDRERDRRGNGDTGNRD
jgi:hypothetical protein